ncbi:MAG: hypothetical protein M1825_003928 [Sarcosagium campestre]|nr:MAG: hypothetical protein M1825_003928 [Sarcosagium campestre]
MRPPRLMIILLTLIALPVILTFFSLVTSGPRRNGPVSAASKDRRTGFKALFSFRSPSSLFPPSAVISLTDDNSTFFLARPAAFGPLLPSRGLSGQLWVGSGFGDDSIGRAGGVPMGAEGELGCSDVPGWSDDRKEPPSDTRGKSAEKERPNFHESLKASSRGDGSASKDKRSDAKLSEEGDKQGGGGGGSAAAAFEDDGTDDYLHDFYPGSDASHATSLRQGMQAETMHNKRPQHADIQSLQESAEISGKVVLLSRGGCGFLEKVKWVQRRGGVALIVGDDTQGGGLVTMYAKGDTSNVTVPSLFTSHTTAHLLSSLIPPGGFSGDGVFGGSRPKPGSLRSVGNKKGKEDGSKERTLPPRADGGPPRSSSKRTSSRSAPTEAANMPFQRREQAGWWRSLLQRIGFGASSATTSSFNEDSRRPPSSGQIDWVLVDDYVDDDDDSVASDKKTSSSGDTASNDDRGAKASPVAPNSVNTPANGDGFVIGVQDWRDPDLIATSKDLTSADAESDRSRASPKADAKQSKSGTAAGNANTNKNNKEDAKGSGGKEEVASGDARKDDKALEGGIITPGSGEYGKIDDGGKSKHGGSSNGQYLKANGKGSDGADGGWLEHLPWGGDGGGPGPEGDSAAMGPGRYARPSGQDDVDSDRARLSDVRTKHHGLWVTLTPTSMSTSPFVDTLLVLVVSPLVTLTVVYALLLVRSRIRRRRWRAPKSVVERLPVRTYHTLSSPTAVSSRAASVRSTSPTSPLLQETSSTASRPRPRSRTTSGLIATAEIPRSRPVGINDRSREEIKPEKSAQSSSSSPEWRRRYTGRQIECVVCLEEYVDGVSRVMSLPCGHEFHSECITPWLTTRRRTCPICKGDVVRSLASPATHHAARFRDDPTVTSTNREGIQGEEEDVQSRAAQTLNESPSAAMPIPTSMSALEHADIEVGEGATSTPTSTSSRAEDHAYQQRRRGGFPLARFGSLRGISAAFGGRASPVRRDLDEPERDR